MSKNSKFILFLGAFLIVSSIWVLQSEAVTPNAVKDSTSLIKHIQIDEAILAGFSPLPAHFESKDNPGTAAKISLGKKLYFEKKLSKAGDISCNSCHQLDKYGVDGEVTSPGHKGQRGNRNSPTVYNAAGHISQFWDGRAPNVEEQAKGPILNPVEMAMPSAEAVVTLLKSIPEYESLFSKAFPDSKDPVSYDHLGLAIGAFERTLVTPSRWDAFLKGDKTVLTDLEKIGLHKFVKTGCIMCHSGALVGGQLYQKLGMILPWENQKDQGRFEHTQVETDKMFFKVPSLRNVEKTGPYLHDGSIATLDEMVKKMAKHQLGKDLSADDVEAIVAWLKTLTGDLPSISK